MNPNLRRAVILSAALSVSGCATMKAIGQDKPENRFGAGVLIAVPGFICGAAGFIPCFYLAGAGWAWGMSGAVEGCVRQHGTPLCR